MKRRVLERHPRELDCPIAREGGRRVVWSGPSGLATIPRHREIATHTAYAIRDRLGVPRPTGR